MQQWIEKDNPKRNWKRWYPVTTKTSPMVMINSCNVEGLTVELNISFPDLEFHVDLVELLEKVPDLKYEILNLFDDEVGG